MFSSGDRYDLSSLLSNQSLTGATGLLGTSGTSPLSTGQDTSGLFQLLLAQMLVKLLDRLEAQVPALTAGLFNSETAAFRDRGFGPEHRGHRARNKQHSDSLSVWDLGVDDLDPERRRIADRVLPPPNQRQRPRPALGPDRQPERGCGRSLRGRSQRHERQMGDLPQ